MDGTVLQPNLDAGLWWLEVVIRSRYKRDTLASRFPYLRSDSIREAFLFAKINCKHNYASFGWQ